MDLGEVFLGLSGDFKVKVGNRGLGVRSIIVVRGERG